MVELTKPRIAVMVLFTVAIAAVVESWGQPNPVIVLHTLFGTLLVAASASAINQWLERDTDAKMQRTAKRPIPAGRVSTQTVMLFASVTVFSGVIYLALLVNPTTALLGVATWVVYGIIYTPLKYRTPLNTAVGAVSGALPVLMGWTAMDGLSALTVDLRWTGLFLTVFFWQLLFFDIYAFLFPLFKGSYRKRIKPFLSSLHLWFVGAMLMWIFLSMIGYFVVAQAYFVGDASLVGIAENGQPFFLMLFAWIAALVVPKYAPKEIITAQRTGVKIVTFIVVFTGLWLLVA